MLPPFTSSLLVTAGLTLFAFSSRAQATFRIGPRVGYILANASITQYDGYTNRTRPYASTYRGGVEAGLQGVIRKGHFAVQPAVLFSQKGFHIDDRHAEALTNGQHAAVSTDQLTRFNYLTGSLNAAYTPRADGQGFHLFAGPCVDWLLGGRYSYRSTYEFNNAGATSYAIDGKVVGSAPARNFDYVAALDDTNYYSGRVDIGVHFGVGYRVGGVLWQVGYTQGLRNMGIELVDASDPFPTSNGRAEVTNRAFQTSLTYLFGPRG